MFVIKSIISDIDGIFTLNEDKLFMLSFADADVLFVYKPETLQSIINDVHAYSERWSLKSILLKQKS